MKKNICIYCGNKDTNFHFVSACCGRGMCDNCYGNLQGTDEQIQVGYSGNDDLKDIKEKYRDSEYLCFECRDIWGI